jgi:hypothetical protein
MLPRVLTVAPSTAISWMSYEFFSKIPASFRSKWLLTSRRGVDQARRAHAGDRPGGLEEESLYDTTRKRMTMRNESP